MNKILEAILKGILMGLEIQDDELDLPTFLKSKVTSDYHADRAEQIKWIRENFVDLDLPSRVRWCKWNIGATNGNTAESWYGNYYAWGDIETEAMYDTSEYKYYDSNSELFTKYNLDDGKQVLDPEDDVVSVTLGENFRMPTTEDFEELCSLPNKWIEDYNGIKGLNGRIFTGNNRNELFIPAAGQRNGSYLIDAGSYCHLWSSSLAGLSSAYYMLFNSGYILPFDYCSRYSGSSVRAVI